MYTKSLLLTLIILIFVSTTYGTSTTDIQEALDDTRLSYYPEKLPVYTGTITISCDGANIYVKPSITISEPAPARTERDLLKDHFISTNTYWYRSVEIGFNGGKLSWDNAQVVEGKIRIPLRDISLDIEKNNGRVEVYYVHEWHHNGYLQSRNVWGITSVTIPIAKPSPAAKPKLTTWKMEWPNPESVFFFRELGKALKNNPEFMKLKANHQKATFLLKYLPELQKHYGLKALNIYNLISIWRVKKTRPQYESDPSATLRKLKYGLCGEWSYAFEEILIGTGIDSELITIVFADNDPEAGSHSSGYTGTDTAVMVADSAKGPFRIYDPFHTALYGVNKKYYDLTPKAFLQLNRKKYLKQGSDQTVIHR